MRVHVIGPIGELKRMVEMKKGARSYERVRLRIAKGKGLGSRRRVGRLLLSRRGMVRLGAHLIGRTSLGSRRM